MDTIIKAATGLVIIIGLVLLGLLATQMGGIAIRNDFSSPDHVTLTVSEPVVRGVPVRVRWVVPATMAERTVILKFRDTTAEYVLAPTELALQEARVKFPCLASANSGSLIMVDEANQQVLAQQLITLLPPLADCALR